MFSSVLHLARRQAVHSQLSPLLARRAAYASSSQNSRLAGKQSAIEADSAAYDVLNDTVVLLDKTPSRAKPSADAFSGPSILHTHSTLLTL